MDQEVGIRGCPVVSKEEQSEEVMCEKSEPTNPPVLKPFWTSLVWGRGRPIPGTICQLEWLCLSNVPVWDRQA